MLRSVKPGEVDWSKVSLVQCPRELEAALAQSKMSGVASHAKLLKKQIANPSEGPSTAMASYRPQVAKAVLAIANKHVGNLLCKVVVPTEHSAVRDEIFSPQGWALVETHMQISVLPYGCTEVRLLLAGSYIVAGVKMTSFGEAEWTFFERPLLDVAV